MSDQDLEGKYFAPLLGKTIAKIERADTGGILRFTESTGAEHYFVAEADCCSESWFEEFIGGLGGVKVTAVEGGSDSPWLRRTSTRQDVDISQYYKISANHHTFSFFLRNSSNGYYCGSVWYGNKMPDWLIKKANKIKFFEVK